jgi:citrate synthase
MNGPDILQQNVGRLRTAMGACYPGTHTVFRGHDLHQELLGMDWVGLYVFSITGRKLTDAQVRTLHAIWVCTSYPDTRLWNNRVAALAASNRSSANLGIVAGLALSEATTYGGQAGLRAITFITEAQRQVAQGAAVGALVVAEKAARRIYGYGRPINSTDERLPWIMQVAREQGLDQGPHVRLAHAIEQVLVPRYPKLKMNYAALHAALIADMGLTPRDYQMLRVPTFLAGMPPCVADAAAKPEGTLFPTPCSGIAYEGVAARAWPGQG